MKKAGFVFCVIVMMMSFARAQEKFRLKTYYDYSVEQMTDMLGKVRTDTERMTLLNSLATNLRSTNNPQQIDTSFVNRLIKINASAKLIDDTPYRMLLKAITAGQSRDYLMELALFKQAIEELDKENIDACNFLMAMRWIFTVADKQEEKLQYYSQKLSFYQQHGLYFNAAACTHCIAGYYAFKGDYNSAINNYLKAGDLFKSYSKTWYINEILVAGENYNYWGNSGRALFFLKKGLKLLNETHITENLSYALVSLSQADYDAKNYKESLQYLDTLSSQKAEKEPLLVPSANILKALDYTELGRLPDAYAALQIAKKNMDASDITRVANAGQYDLEYAWYKYYLAIDELPAAEKFLLSAYHKSMVSTSTGLKLLYLKELAKYYGNQDSTAKAWKYTVLYNRSNDSLQNKVNNFKIAGYEGEQVENAQNKKLEGLQQQGEVQQATISQRNYIIWVTLIGLLLVCGSLVFIYRQLRINKRNLINLRQTQRQLIQSEKMASLGELTAGIAHEIQNPLNFVNNFSDVSIELLDEMEEELKLGQTEDAIDIAGDVKQNLEKIRHHGQRADGIVKGMLEHSRVGTGEKQQTDLNALADEFLKFSYHGLRAKDQLFNAELIMHLDEKLPKPVVSQQDIGRVLLNLFNNAFYAVNQRSKTAGADYKPIVEVSTWTKNGAIEIKIKDNGNGIPEAIKDKIMQPFFTTKPTGEGTGLGLSLSYDIVTKGHRGSITVNTVVGEGSEFIVILPING